ncbi:MAG: Mu transposase C-terminal domain-containing protein, partial [Aeoliella sp.]
TELNQVLAAWLDTDYRTTIHSETNQTPQERYQADCRFHRHVDVTTVEAFFHRREKRTVDRTFIDVRIGGQYFKVDLALRGEKVIVKYDPFHHDPETQEVELYSFDGAYLGVGKRYEREKGAHPDPSVVPVTGPIEPHYLDALRADQEAAHELQRSAGLDYHSAQQRNIWSLSQFAAKLARLLGREGGLSSFTPDEMETLRAFHLRHNRINESMLKQAFAAAEARSIPHVLFQLQLLLHERNA